MWKRWRLKDDIFYSAFKLQLNVTSSAFRTKLVQDSFLHTGFATPNIYYKWRSPPIYFPLSVAERPCQTVCFERTRICWNSREILSLTNVIITPRTFRWGSAVTQYVSVTLLPFQAPSLRTQVTNSGNSVLLMLILPKGQVSYLKHSSSCLDCSSGILRNIASRK